MSNIIKHIRIDSLFGTKNIDWELNPSVNVLVGQNGSGKSTILRLIKSILVHRSGDELNLADNIYFTFDDKLTLTAVRDIDKSVDMISAVLFKGLEDTSLLAQKKNGKLITIEDIFDSAFKNAMKDISNNLKNTQKELANNPPYVFNDIDKKINIEFISTIDMNANSINNIRTSSGQNTTLLDIEIKNEIQRLLAFNEDGLKENLLSALNSLFSETQKTIEFNKSKLMVKLSNSEEIPFSRLSSGERQVIFIFLKVVNASVDGALILMDEPEISLHLSWQEKLLNEIRRVNEKSQIIIVTHSPAILMNGWMDSFVDIKNIMTDATVDDDNTLNDSTS